MSVAMIAYRDERCAGCRCCATREITDEFGEPLLLCDRCPSPEEIAERTAEVRSNWGELEHWCRRFGVTREAALNELSLRFEVVVVVPPNVPSRRGKSIVPTEW
jgi:hypothetical protein